MVWLQPNVHVFISNSFLSNTIGQFFFLRLLNFWSARNFYTFPSPSRCKKTKNNNCNQWEDSAPSVAYKGVAYKTCTLGCNHTILSLIWACYTSKEREKQELYAEQLEKFEFIHWICRLRLIYEIFWFYYINSKVSKKVPDNLKRPKSKFYYINGVWGLFLVNCFTKVLFNKN